MRLNCVLALCLSVLVFHGVLSSESILAGEETNTIDAMVSRRISPDGPGAAVIAVKDGQAIIRKAYGLADIELDVPMAPEHVFRIGSITKSFTAAAVMLLVESGELQLDDPVRKILPDYPQCGDSILIEHLLTHSSGIPSYTDLEAFDSIYTKDVDVETVVDLFKNLELEFRPGDHLHYSNSGYFLLGAIIEKVSGQKYADFIEQRIFKPLHMTNSCYGDNTRVISLRAKGYSLHADTVVNASYISMKPPFSAGGLLSTVDDLAKWDAALYSDILLSDSSRARMFTPFEPAVSGPRVVGFGWEIDDFRGFTRISHGGGIDGFNGYVMRIPEEKLFVAVLENTDATTYSSEYLVKKITAFLLGRPFPEYIPCLMQHEQLVRYAGKYVAEDGVVRTISVVGDKIYSQREGSIPLEVRPASDSVFIFPGRFSHYVFRFDETGLITGFEKHDEENDQVTFSTRVKGDD